MKKVFMCLVLTVWMSQLASLRSEDNVLEEFGINYPQARLAMQKEFPELEKQAQYDVKQITAHMHKYANQTIHPVEDYAASVSVHSQNGWNEATSYQL